METKGNFRNLDHLFAYLMLKLILAKIGVNEWILTKYTHMHRMRQKYIVDIQGKLAKSKIIDF